jgi:hypothetical protein
VDTTTVGFGEVGLPPKKPRCYLADFDDVVRFFDEIASNVRSVLRHFCVYLSPWYLSWQQWSRTWTIRSQIFLIRISGPFAPALTVCVSAVLSKRKADGAYCAAVIVMLRSLLAYVDASPASTWPEAPPARAGFEAAVLDACGRRLASSVSAALHPCVCRDSREGRP